MKKNKALSWIGISLFVWGSMTACDDGSLDHDDVYIPDPVEESDEDDGYSSEPTTQSVLRIQLGADHEHQTIQGFGCAFCGWAASTYTSTQRTQIMEDLFGEDGLNFNIFRGEVYPSYMYPDGNYDFGMDRTYQLPPNDPTLIDDYWGEFNGESSGLQMQLAQMWLVDYLQKKNRDDIYYFFSVWSPPGQWKKDIPDPTKPLLGGWFNEEANAEYAKFLVDFMKAYRDKFGINIYGISGWNEPTRDMGGWASCRWNEEMMADFVHNHLRPQMNASGFNDTKIIYAEPAWWSDAVSFMKNTFNGPIDITGDNIVAAGHAYSSAPNSMEEIEIPEGHDIPVWLTETCDDKSRNESWEDAMKWASWYQGYLSDIQMNALVWWAGARNCSTTGENLLQMDGELPSMSYYPVGRYYSIGQFSKWIARGMKRVDVEKVSDKKNKIPKDLTASAYVNGDTYTIVIVNGSKKDACETLLEIEGKSFKNMISYTSSESVKWLRKKQNPSLSGKRSIVIPKYSVVTITGKFTDSVPDAGK